MNEGFSRQTELSVGSIISNGITIGVKNAATILITYLLYSLSSWVPYLNIGTTIALNDLTPKLARGESISPSYIFEDEYRQNFGEFFILLGLMLVAILGTLGTVGASMILAIAWSLAGPLFVDRKMGAIEALRESNRLTHGNKLTILLASLVFIILLGIVGAIAAFSESVMIIIIVSLIAIVFVLPVLEGMKAWIYRELTVGSQDDDDSAEQTEPVPVY